MRLRLHRDVLARESITSRVLDFSMELPLRFPALTTALTIYQQRELDQLHILREVLRPGDVVLDIGANIGYYPTIEGRAVGAAGQVIAYEPDPRNQEFLRRNARRNGLSERVVPVAKALSDEKGRLTFQIAAASNLNSVRRTRATTAINYADRAYVDTIEVEVDDLADLLATSARPIDVMRMDVEGHEVEILRALARHVEQRGLERAPRAIVFEPHSWEYTAENGIEASLRTLAAHGYRITHMGSRDEARSPMHALGWKPTLTKTELRGVTRGVYEDPPQEDAIRLASGVDGVTTVCLQR